MSKKIVVTIKKGVRSIQAVGFKGEGCESLVTGLAAKLGTGRETKNEHTAEYYQSPEQIESQRQENR